MIRAFVVAVTVLAVTACGSESTNDDEMDDRRYHECIEAGGSFENGDYNEFKCKMPETVTVSPSPF